MHLFNASKSVVVGPEIALPSSLLGNCNSTRPAANYESLMTLERYEVASYSESGFVRKLSFGRSADVFTSLLFNCTIRVLDQPFCASCDQLRARYALTIFRTMVQHIVALGFRNRTSLDSYVLVFDDPERNNVLDKQMFGQLSFEVSDLRPRSKHCKVVTVSDDADVIDCGLVQTRIEHSDVISNPFHYPFAIKIKALSCVICSVHDSVEHDNISWTQ